MSRCKDALGWEYLEVEKLLSKCRGKGNHTGICRGYDLTSILPQETKGNYSLPLLYMSSVSMCVCVRSWWWEGSAVILYFSHILFCIRYLFAVSLLFFSSCTLKYSTLLMNAWNCLIFFHFLRRFELILIYSFTLEPPLPFSKQHHLCIFVEKQAWPQKTNSRQWIS